MNWLLWIGCLDKGFDEIETTFECICQNFTENKFRTSYFIYFPFSIIETAEMTHFCRASRNIHDSYFLSITLLPRGLRQLHRNTIYIKKISGNVQLYKLVKIRTQSSVASEIPFFIFGGCGVVKSWRGVCP